MLEHECAYWAEHSGCLIAGIDEAGRGCLAGPVVAAAVAISPAVAVAFYSGALAGLTDSKQLTAARRDHYFALLTQNAEVQWGVGMASPEEIDRINILNATHLAMRRAIEALPAKPDHALVDGLPVKGLPVPSTAIVKGDSKSLLIAAASVIAKVSRDRLMRELDALYPAYAFARNKGYGAREHMAALIHEGASPVHRKTFRPVADVLERLPGF